jgi:hypothetical protein
VQKGDVTPELADQHRPPQRWCDQRQTSHHVIVA